MKKKTSRAKVSESKKTHLAYPQGAVLYRNLSRSYPIVERAKGPYIWDKSGKKYFDGSGGALVVSLGHSNAELLESYFKHLRRVTYLNGMQFTSDVLEQFCEKIHDFLPDKTLSRKVAVLGSGSEAIEAAVKFVRQLWVERGESQREIFIARSPGYHGNTLFALSASARPYYRKFFGPLLNDVRMVKAPYEYRHLGDSYESSADLYLQEIEETILKAGPHKVAGVLAETVGGSSTGASVPPPGYFKKLRALCDKYGILVIADEVMCGAGRTGTFFAYESQEFSPDIIVLGKGINAGLMPMSVIVVRADHVAEMKKGSGSFMHAQTYMQVPSAAAAGISVLEYLKRHKVLQQSRKLSVLFHKKLRALKEKFDFVGHTGGQGLFAGIEFVKNKNLKTPFDRSQKIAERFVDCAFEEGLVVWPNTSQADGTHGDLFMLGPPLNMTTVEMQDLVDRLEMSLKRLQKNL